MPLADRQADQAEWRRRRREALNAIKLERGCADCGYNAHPAALEFDHVGDDKTRGGNGSDAIHLQWAWQRILDEIAKCEVVCANCHHIRTAARGYIGGRPMHRRTSS